MKLQTIALSALIALSAATTVSADWMDGMQNGTGAGDVATKGNTDLNAFGKGAGNADGEVEFAISFKAKGKTDMASDMAGNGKGDFAGNGNGKAEGNSTAATNTAVTAQEQNSTK
jgi:hypothetical protein